MQPPPQSRPPAATLPLAGAGPRLAGVSLLLARVSLLLPLAACGDDASRTRPVTPETERRLQQLASPTTWEDLDPERPGTRLRDPRTGIVFVRVPAGRFVMGGTSVPHEGPPHPVELSRPFLLASTEVTVAAFRRYLDEHGGQSAGAPPTGDGDLPVGDVSWQDATAFCARYGYRLPTEAEWERACRGGLEPDDAAAPWRSQQALLPFAWFHANAADLGPQPVGGKAANGYGLHDMLGNLWEWTADWFQAYPPDAAPRVDPSCPEERADAPLRGRVLRGGSFFTAPLPEPSQRAPTDPNERTPFYGFRPAADVPE